MLRVIATPCNAYISTSIVQASRPICAILAANIGIARRSCRGGEKTYPTRAALRPHRAAPDALSLPALTGLVHPVVLVSRADQWEVMAPDRQAAVEGAGAMLAQGPVLCGHAWLAIRFVLPGCEERPATACGPVNLSEPSSRVIS